MLFSQETLFQDCDDEPQAEDIQAVQDSCDFDQASRLLKMLKL